LAKVSIGAAGTFSMFFDPATVSDFEYPSGSGRLALISFLELAFQKSGPTMVSTS
jgi:hypothetical protein